MNFEMETALKCFVVLLCVALFDAKREFRGGEEDPEFRCDYKFFPDADGWLKLHEVPTNWHDARLRCELEGAILASPLSAGIGTAMMTLKAKVINTTVPDGKTPISIYTGIHATFSIKDYSSVEGVPLAYIRHKWSKGSPYSDLVGDADSLIMGPDGGLSGVDSEEAEYPFICYRKYESRPINACSGTFDDKYFLEEKTGSCYKFHSVARSWRKAYMTCSAEGGHLVVINGKDEANIVKELLATNRIPENKDHERSHKNREGYEEEESGEEGGLQNILHVGFTRSEVSKWQPLTIDGQTLDEAGYSRLGTRHGDPRGLCGAFDEKAYLINTGCNNMWYRFVCEKKPGRTHCFNE